MRFVVLHHTDWPGHADHYDLMLQLTSGDDDNDRVLATFATSDDRFPQPGMTLKRIDDHRRCYLSLEGPLSGNRGRVQRADEGEFQLTAQSPSRLEFSVQGQRLNGCFILNSASGGVFALTTP